VQQVSCEHPFKKGKEEGQTLMMQGAAKGMEMSNKFKGSGTVKP
jgi:hypothetical protein